MISDYFQGRQRERWLGNQAAVGSLCSIVMIALGGVLGGAFGWRGVFAVYAISLPLALCVWRFTWEPGDRPDAGETLSIATGGKAVFPWRRMAGICAVTLVASIMFYTLLTQTALALGELGVRDPAQAGLFTVIATLGVPLGAIAFRKLSRLPVAALISLEFLIIGAGFAGMGLAPTPPLYVAAALVNQFGCGMILPTLLTWATAGLPFEVRGRGNGIWQATFAVGQFLTVLVTLLAAHVHGVQPAFVVLAGVNVAIAAAAVAMLTRFRGTIGRAGASMQPV